MTVEPWRAWLRRHAAVGYEWLTTIAWVVTLGGVLAGAIGWLLPATQTIVRPHPWAVEGQWHYTAGVPLTVAPDGRLPLGAPLYRTLTPRVTFAFATRWAAETPRPADVVARVRLWTRLQDDFGWQREVTLAEQTFSQVEWHLEAALNLNHITGWIRTRERALPPPRQYRLLVGVTWQAQGRLAGQPWRAEGTSVLSFGRQAPNLYVLQLPSRGPVDTSAPAWWAPRWEGALETTQAVPRQVALGPWRIPVPALRTWGLRAALAGGALELALSGVLAWLRSRWPEVYALAALGPVAVWVEPGLWLTAARRDVARTSPQGLLRLAQHWGEPVLVTCDEVHLVALVRLPEAVYVHEEPCAPRASLPADAEATPLPSAAPVVEGPMHDALPEEVPHEIPEA